MNEGKIVDASFVESPRQRNKKEENEHIKATGAAPENWQENPHKLAQKDVDARWTKKGTASYYGYKNHTKVDSKSKIITDYAVTDASVHDSQVLEGLLNEKDEGQSLYADSAYIGQDEVLVGQDEVLVGQDEVLGRHQMKDRIGEKGFRNKPLTEAQKERNREKSKVRSRVEHVFGLMEQSMGGMLNRTIGMRRAETVIGLMNLTYNMFRKIQLMP